MRIERPLMRRKAGHMLAGPADIPLLPWPVLALYALALSVVAVILATALEVWS